MRLGWMLLSNYAEDNRGLINISGAGWDTIEARAPIVGAPGVPDDQQPKALIQGFLVMRLLFHPTETGRDLAFTVIIIDADGNEVAKASGQAHIAKIADLPPGWLQGVNMIVPLGGIPLPKFGHYSVVVLADNQHVGDLSFRVLKKY